MESPPEIARRAGRPGRLTQPRLSAKAKPLHGALFSGQDFPGRPSARDIGGRHLKLGHDARGTVKRSAAVGAIVFMQHHRAGAGQPRLQQAARQSRTGSHRGQIDDLGPFARPQAVGGAAAVLTSPPAPSFTPPNQRTTSTATRSMPCPSIACRIGRPARAARLAVIVKTVFLADLVGPAGVRGLGIAVRGEEAHRLIHRGHGRGKGGEAAFDVSSWCAQGAVSVWLIAAHCKCSGPRGAPSRGDPALPGPGTSKATSRAPWRPAPSRRRRGPRRAFRRPARRGRPAPRRTPARAGARPSAASVDENFFHSGKRISGSHSASSMGPTSQSPSRTATSASEGAIGAHLGPRRAPAPWATRSRPAPCTRRPRVSAPLRMRVSLRMTALGRTA